MVHGWSAAPDLWQPVCRCVEQLDPARSPEWHFADPHWASDGARREPAGFPGGRYDLAVGHSAGLLWLLCGPLPANRLVSIAGFSRFWRDENFLHGWDGRILKRMRRNLGEDVAAVLKDFHQQASSAAAGRADYAGPVASPDPVRLDSGLQALSTLDCREQWSLFDGPRQVIAGTEDRIVPARQTVDCFPDDSVEWIKSESHWIPWLFPETCAALILETLARERS